MKAKTILGVFTLSWLLGAGAFAGTSEVRSKDGDVSRFEYSGDMLRIGVGNQPDGYMVMRDGRVYVVTDSDGNVMVMDISQALGMFGAMANAATPSMTDDEVLSLKATGRKETHAGVTGEVYILRYRDSDGREQETELVLTDDKRALEFRDAMLRFAEAMSRNMGAGQQASSNNMQKELMALNKGVLRYGDEMSVVSLDMSPVEASRFDLPAPPTDLGGLGAILSGALSGQQQPANSGGSADRGEGADAPADGAEQAPPPNPADEIGNALRSIFGR